MTTILILGGLTADRVPLISGSVSVTSDRTEHSLLTPADLSQEAEPASPTAGTGQPPVTECPSVLLVHSGLTADGRSLIAGAIAAKSNESAEQQQRIIEDIPLPLAEPETPGATGGEPEKEQPPPPSEEAAALRPVEAVQSVREQEETTCSPEEFKESPGEEGAIQAEERACAAPVESQERPIEQAPVRSDIVAEPPPSAGAFLSTKPPLGDKPEGEPIFVHDSAAAGAKESSPQSATVNTSVATKFASSFATSATDSATVEAAKTTKLASVEQDSRRLASLLLSLGRMRAADPPKYTSILERLEQLEKELGALNVVPPDPALSELVGQILTSDYPNSDLQIIVSTSRKTTTSKQFYETETPGMVGLAPEQLQDLQRKLMAKISSPDDTVFGTVGSENGGPTSALPAGAVQKKEVVEDDFATNDGNEVVSKKMTRVVTTSQSAVSGV
ncbi:ankyrin-related unc-44 [Aphelenchoides avenae]|nr:ankyrin-related unc-44 [Aphelenchus avenae]